MTTTTKIENFISPNWPAPPRIRAYTSLRESGVSLSPTGIDKALLKQLLQLPNEPIWLKQTHSIDVVEALPHNEGMEADASITDKVNQICVVLTADCLPLLLCNKEGTQVAAIHAGWRGLANGIIEATIKQLAIPSSEILVWLGPAISSAHFEVRKDVYDAFISIDPEYDQGFKKINAEQWMGNLYTLAKLRLKKMGIEAIYGGDKCTFSDDEHFFSYRRDGKTTGRIISLIWIADNT